MYFYPRPPRGGRRERSNARGHPTVFLSTPSARRATLRRQKERRPSNISIHALREEGDKQQCSNELQQRNFYPRPPRGGRPGMTTLTSRDSNISIHALREEGDGVSERPRTVQTLFLSTPSARRATPLGPLQTVYGRISIHALREEGDSGGVFYWDEKPISIHALREEGDAFSSSSVLMSTRFLSTPSARRATCSTSTRCSTNAFLSTPSARRATRHQRPCILLQQISIHALREEGDLSGGAYTTHRLNFYPRPPRGGRL